MIKEVTDSEKGGSGKMKEIERLIEQYAKKIQNDINVSKDVYKDVSALANLVKAKADSDLATRYYKTNC